MVEEYELQRFCKAQPISKKRGNSSKPKPSSRKKVRFQLNSSEEDTTKFIDDNSEDEEERTTSVTRSGRKLNQRKTYETEFYSGKLGKKVNTAKGFHVPVPEDENFITHHSERCYRCNGTGSHTGPVDILVGPEAKRLRLFQCRSCSYSIHNNCLPQIASSYFENGQVSCVKCQRKNNCTECQMNIPSNSDKEIAFRCNLCFRGFHNKCIKKGVSSSLIEKAEKTDILEIYENGLCIECMKFGQKSATIIAERKVDNKTEFLLKWKNISYRHTDWVVKSWMQGAQPTAYRAYIKKRSEKEFITQNRIPIEWQTVDRILNVEWLDKNKLKAKRILAVYKDTSYENGKEIILLFIMYLIVYF